MSLQIYVNHTSRADDRDDEGLTSSMRQGATSSECLDFLTGIALVFLCRGGGNIGWAVFEVLVLDRRKSKKLRRGGDDELVSGAKRPGVRFVSFPQKALPCISVRPAKARKDRTILT
jgi:hypothetical protein